MPVAQARFRACSSAGDAGTFQRLSAAYFSFCVSPRLPRGVQGFVFVELLHVFYDERYARTLRVFVLVWRQFASFVEKATATQSLFATENLGRKFVELCTVLLALA